MFPKELFGMPLEFWICTGSIFGCVVLMTLIMKHNLQMLRETKQERLEARRAQRAARKERWKQYKNSSIT